MNKSMLAFIQFVKFILSVFTPSMLLLLFSVDIAHADIYANLIGHWTFDELAGVTAIDASGNGHDATLINGPVWVSGKIGGAIDFDGVNDYVNAGSASSLDDIPVKTISAWIRRKDLTRSQNIAMKGSTGGQGGWEFYSRRSTGGRSANRIGYNHEWSGSPWQSAIWFGSTNLDIANIWYHVVVIYDARSASNIPTMYVNGIQETVTVDQAAVGVEANDAANSLTLGGAQNNSASAALDEVRVYDRALSTADVQELYNLGSPTTYQCSDGIDNDGDGLIDFPNDPGCSAATDNDEFNPVIDTTPPTTPGNLQAAVIATTQVNLSWNTATDNIGVTGYNLYRDGTLITSTTGTAYNNTGLSPATTYNYRVAAYDAAGNVSPLSASIPATTQTPPQCSDGIDNDGDGLIDFPNDPGCSAATDNDEFNPVIDTTPPTTPGNLQAAVIATTQVNLSWNTATDNIGVTGYNLYRDGALITSTTGTAYNNTGLSPATTYNYRVAAYDAAGNVSPLSASIPATTQTPPQCSDGIDNDGDGLIDFPNDPGCSSVTDNDEFNPVIDTTPPTTPGNLQAAVIATTQVNLSWNTATDNIGVTGYNLYRDGTLITSTTGTAYNNTGLSPATTYNYRVAAYDAAGNVSPLSASIPATTPSSSQNILGHWTFDEGAGLTVYDVSGNGHDGTLINGPGWTTGKIGGAIDLDGVNDYINMGSTATLDDIPVKTIAGWIKRKDITRSQHIATKGFTGGAGGWEFYVRRSTGGRSANRLGYNHEWNGSRWSSAIWYGSTNLDLTNAWYHVAIIYDSRSPQNIPIMYVNGAQETITVDQAAAGTEASDAANNFTLGGVSNNSAFASLDDIRLYNRALTTTEIQQLYSLGGPITYQCSDGLDNDGDGLIDFPNDPGCSSATDNDETNAPAPNPFTNVANWSTYKPAANGVGVNPVGYNGGVFDGRYIYYSPYLGATSEVLRFDTTAPFNSNTAWTAFNPNPPSGGGYVGNVFDGRYVYFVPYGDGLTVGHGEVLRYDTTLPFSSASSWTTFDPGSYGLGIDPDGYWGAHFDGRYIYFAPEWANPLANGEVMRYDTTLPFNNVTSWIVYDPGANGVGVDPDGYKGIVSDGTYIYFVPYWNGSGSHGEVLRYTLSLPFNSASSWTTFDPGINGVGNIAKGYEDAVFDGKYIYFVASYASSSGGYHGEFMRYDTTLPFTAAASWNAYDPGANGIGVDPDGYHGGYFDGKYIYFAPSYNGNAPNGEVLRLDTSSVFNTTAAWNVFSPAANGVGVDPRGYAGAVSDGRYVYFVPNKNGLGYHDEILRYDLTPGVP